MIFLPDTTNTIITGLGNSVPKWATESTLAEIQEEIVKIVEAIDKKTKLKKLDISGDQKALTEHEKKLKELNKDQDDNQKKIKKRRKEAELHWLEEVTAFENIKKSMQSQSKSTNLLVDVTEGLGSVFKTLTSPTAMIGESFALAGFALSKFIGYLENTMGAVVGLYDNGQILQQGLGELTLAASKAIMPLDDFAKLVVKNNSLVKSFGKDGIASFGNLLGQTNKLAKAQFYYGMSISSINAYTSDYLELLRKQGNSTRWIQENGAQAANEYIKQLTAYSQILGKSREEIAKQMQDAMHDPEVKAAMLAMTDAQRTAFTKTSTQISSIFGPEFQKQFNEAALTPYGPQSDLSLALGSVSGELDNLYLNMAKMAGEGKDITPQLQEFGKGIENLSQEQKDQLKLLVTSRTGLASGANVLVDSISSLRGNEKNLNKLNAAMGEAPDEFTKSAVALANTIDSIKAKFSTVFGSFIVSHQDILNKMITNLSNAADQILAWLDKFLSPQTRQKAIDDLKDGLKSLMTMVTTAMIDAIKSSLGMATSADNKGDAIDQFNNSSYLGKGATILGRGLGWTGSAIQAIGEAPADVGSWAGSEIGAGINWATGRNSAAPQATPKINTPRMPTESGTKQSVPQVKDDDVSKKLDKLIDLQTINNDQNSTMNIEAAKSAAHLKAIKQNINSDSNVVQ